MTNETRSQVAREDAAELSMRRVVAEMQLLLAARRAARKTTLTLHLHMEEESERRAA